MKRYIMICAAILVGIVYAQAESISIGSVSMDKGETKTVSISLTNSHTDLVSFQMDLYLPDGITLNKTGCSLSSRFGSSYELTIGKQSDGSYRLTSTSFSLTPISGTSGSIITLSLTASQTAIATTASIKNILFVTSSSTSITVANTSFGVTVRGDQTLSMSSLPSQTYGNTYSLPSQTNQGLTLTWTVANSSVATVSGSILTARGTGTTTVTATQAGNNSYLPFTKSYTLTVNKATLTVTAKSYSMVYGSTLPTFEATYTGFKNNDNASVLTTQLSFSCTATSSSAVGQYDINVSGAAAQNYVISYVKGTLTITAKNASNLTIGSIAAVTYNGSEQTPTVTVKDGSTTLTSGTDYTVAYSNNTNAGTATVTVTGKGNYTGTKTASFTINARNASNFTISDIAAQTYTGSAITPTVTVKDGSTTLTSGTDYTVAYSNNTNVGTATVTVTGKGNYTGTKTATFTINAKSASNLTISSIAAQTYTGSAITPTVTVKDGSTTLTSGTDYTVAYSDNTNVGTATVTVTGKGNYAGTKTATFTINAKAASNLTISSIAAQTYTGSALTPTVTVKDGTKTLTSGTDYTVTYSDNTNVGTATVTVTGKGNYTGTKTATFTINAKAASNLTISSIAAQTYTGSALTPAVTVKDGSTTLTSGTDYTISYSNNTNAGTATVTVTGKGNYTGTKTATFTINAKAASNFTISEIAAVTYNGSAHTPTVTVKDGNSTLTSGTDYTVAYSNNTNAGTATVSITGKGNYTGTKTATFTINAKNASDLTISSIAAQTYTGSALTPAVTVKDGTTTLTSGTDYTVTYSDNTNAGTATVTVTGNGNYTGTKTATFTINAKNASNLTISSIAAQTYTGSALTPTVTVKDGSTTLTSGTDYTVAYSNNTNVGTATVTVTGKGNYTGTKTATFTINAKAASNLTISSIAAQTYTGSAITPSITVKDGNKTLTSGTDYTIAYSNNINAGTATVTVTGKGNYTGTYSASFTINKAVLKIIANNCNKKQWEENPELTVRYQGFLRNDNTSSLKSLPTITTTATLFSPAGTYPITVSGADADNYEISYEEGTLTITLCHFIAVENADGVTICYTFINNNTELSVTYALDDLGDYIHTYWEDVVIPETVTYCGTTYPVTSIDESAFYDCSDLISVTIPETVTSIGNYAFYDCTGLTSVTIPSSVTYIDYNAFDGCNSLESVNISDIEAWYNISFTDYSSNPLYYAHHLYLNGTEIKDLVIPNSVTSIGDYTFSGCSGLTSITIPNSVTSIGNMAFYECSGLTSVTIPNSVTSIGINAFNGCIKLTSVITEKETPVSISSSVFSNRANAKLYVPKGTKSAYAAANYWTEFKAIKEFPDGDVNEDGETDVVDVVDIARTVIEELTGDVIMHLADLNNSNSVTVADAIVLINDIAGDTNWAKPMMAQSRAAANDVLKLVSSDGNNLSLQMDGNGQYAAFQFDLWLPENVDVMEMALNNERRQGHQLLYNKVGEGHYRVVALSTAANIFKGSSGELLDMTLDGFATDNIQVDDIRFVTPEGSERLFETLGVTRNGITTSIDGMNGDDNCDKRTVYNLNGQRMNTPQRGLNIINGRKVVIK